MSSAPNGTPTANTEKPRSIRRFLSFEIVVAVVVQCSITYHDDGEEQFRLEFVGIAQLAKKTKQKRQNNPTKVIILY